jgi:hypothetical protein
MGINLQGSTLKDLRQVVIQACGHDRFLSIATDLCRRQAATDTCPSRARSAASYFRVRRPRFNKLETHFQVRCNPYAESS